MRSTSYWPSDEIPATVTGFLNLMNSERDTYAQRLNIRFFVVLCHSSEICHSYIWLASSHFFYRTTLPISAAFAPGLTMHLALLPQYVRLDPISGGGTSKAPFRLSMFLLLALADTELAFSQTLSIARIQLYPCVVS